jgi:hypothetical protein
MSVEYLNKSKFFKVVVCASSVDLTVFYSTSTTPSMVNLQQFLLSVLPVIGDRPAPIFLAPAFAAAVSDDGGIDDFLHAIYEYRTS